MADTMEIESQWAVPQILALCLSQESGLLHLFQHNITALQATLRLADRIEIAGIFAHAHKQSTLASIERHRIFAEVSLCGRLDTDSIVQEVEIVEVHPDDFLLRIETLQLQGDNPFDRLLQKAFLRCGCFLGVELLGQLLCDGATAARAFLLQYATFHNSSHQCPKVDAVMLVETDILCGNKCLHQSRGQFIEVGEDTVGTAVAPGTQLLAIGREDLRSKLVDGILQLLDVGHIAYSTCEDAVEYDTDDDYAQYVTRPKEDEQFLSHQKCRFKTTKVQQINEK